MCYTVCVVVMSESCVTMQIYVVIMSESCVTMHVLLL